MSTKQDPGNHGVSPGSRVGKPPTSRDGNALVPPPTLCTPSVQAPYGQHAEMCLSLPSYP